MNTQIREALASDVVALIALSRRTISASYRPFLGDEAVDAFIGSGAVDQYIKENLDGCTVWSWAMGKSSAIRFAGTI